MQAWGGGNFQSTDTNFYNPGLGCECSASANNGLSSSYLYTSEFDSTTHFSFSYSASSSLLQGENIGPKWCNYLDLIHGFVIPTTTFWAVDPITSMAMEGSTGKGVTLHKILQMTYGLTHSQIGLYSYFASFSALKLTYGLNVLSDPSLNPGYASLNSQWTQNNQVSPLQFCNGYPYETGQAQNHQTLNLGFDSIGNVKGDPDCVVFALNTYDNLKAVNPEQLNLQNAHCNDMFTMPDSAWSKDTKWRYDTSEVPDKYNVKAGSGLLYNPPEKLVQEYFICYNSILTSLALAFGSSVGTAGVAATIVTTFLVIALTSGLSIFSRKKKMNSDDNGDDNDDNKNKNNNNNNNNQQE